MKKLIGSASTQEKLIELINKKFFHSVNWTINDLGLLHNPNLSDVKNAHINHEYLVVYKGGRFRFESRN